MWVAGKVTLRRKFTLRIGRSRGRKLNFIAKFAAILAKALESAFQGVGGCGRAALLVLDAFVENLPDQFQQVMGYGPDGLGIP